MWNHIFRFIHTLTSCEVTWFIFLKLVGVVTWSILACALCATCEVIDFNYLVLCRNVKSHISIYSHINKLRGYLVQLSEACVCRYLVNSGFCSLRGWWNCVFQPCSWANGRKSIIMAVITDNLDLFDFLFYWLWGSPVITRWGIDFLAWQCDLKVLSIRLIIAPASNSCCWRRLWLWWSLK
jgi:hypothetical protein